MDHSETFVPGMGYNPYQSPQESSNETKFDSKSTIQQPQTSTNAGASGKPVVGFLYSISNNGISEYWPVRIGKNVIGRSPSCDIQLKEQSISGTHVILNVKKMKSTGKFIASIQDVGGSGTGLYLNDEELDYEIHSCKHEDILVVGGTYKLVLFIIDPAKYDLEPCENFVYKEDAESEAKSKAESVIVEKPMMNPYNANINATVDLSGANKIVPGSTMILD